MEGSQNHEATPEYLDRTGKPWAPGCGRPAAHPNSPFTTPMANNPMLDARLDDPGGVPI